MTAGRGGDGQGQQQQCSVKRRQEKQRARAASGGPKNRAITDCCLNRVSTLLFVRPTNLGEGGTAGIRAGGHAPRCRRRDGHLEHHRAPRPHLPVLQHSPWKPYPPKEYQPPLLQTNTTADRDDNKPGKKRPIGVPRQQTTSRLTTLASSKNSACTRKRRATSHRRSPRTVLNGRRTSSTGTRSGPTSTLTRTVVVPARRRTMQATR